MRKHLLAVATALAALVGLADPVMALPLSCGNTITVTSGQSLPGSTLLTAGTCVAAGDKIFGDFGVGGAITGIGSGSFTFLGPTGNVTVGFSGVVGPNQTGDILYTVQIAPGAAAAGWRITDLQKDFTINAADVTGFATATLTGSASPTTPAANFDCTRTVNPSTSSCPQTALFDPVLGIDVVQTITTGADAVVTGITDTVSQTQLVPEPASLALLGSALLGMGVLRRRRHAG